MALEWLGVPTAPPIKKPSSMEYMIPIPLPLSPFIDPPPPRLLNF